jgi:hypothetical protein
MNNQSGGDAKTKSDNSAPQTSTGEVTDHYRQTSGHEGHFDNDRSHDLTVLVSLSFVSPSLAGVASHPRA